MKLSLLDLLVRIERAANLDQLLAIFLEVQEQAPHVLDDLVNGASPGRAHAASGDVPLGASGERKKRQQMHRRCIKAVARLSNLRLHFHGGREEPRCPAAAEQHRRLFFSDLPPVLERIILRVRSVQHLLIAVHPSLKELTDTNIVGTMHTVRRDHGKAVGDYEAHAVLKIVRELHLLAAEAEDSLNQRISLEELEKDLERGPELLSAVWEHLKKTLP